MAVHGENRCISVVAGADLSSGAQFKVIAVGGTIAATNLAGIGILQNRPKSGENASLVYDGHAKAYVGGGAITAGAALKVTTSGFLVAVASGDGAVAKAVTAAASGSLCEVLCDFKTGLTTY